MSPASEPEPAAEEFASCAVCGRTILRGERLHDYLDTEGETAAVCVLCKSHAEASGWIPATHAATFSRRTAARRRPGLRLRERLARRRPPAEDTDKAPPARGPEATPERAARYEEAGAETGDSLEPAAPRPAPGAPPAPEPEPPSPLEVFNASDRPRTIAGLMRSLGEPRATVRSTPDGELVTVAWELSWYQWRVSDGEVSEVAKGGELSELSAEDREWNASLAEDGQLVLG